MTSRNRRPFEWYETAATMTSLGANAQTHAVIRSAIDQGAANLRGSTVTRLVGWVALKASTLTVLAELAFGIIIVNADARIAAALPDPNDPSDRANWMYRDRLLCQSGNLSDSSQWDRIRFDIRSQRIMRSEEDELVIIFNAGPLNNPDFAFNIRSLIKLPG